MEYACLDCGAPSPKRRCPRHDRAGNTSWNGQRDRGAQARFRRAVLDAAGHRCQLILNGVRCTQTTGLAAHHREPGNDDPATGLALCNPCHRLVDRHAR